MLANTVAKGEGFGPRALSVSEGGGKLAFIGPLDSTITVLDAHTLDEVSSQCLLIQEQFALLSELYNLSKGR